MKYVERKKTPPAGIPPGVEPAQSRMLFAGVIPFGMKERRARYARLGRAVKKN